MKLKIIETSGIDLISAVRNKLHYSQETGIFKWKVQAGNRVKIGDATGCLEKNGYLRIRLNSKNYLAHRLAWIYVHGFIPSSEIDHINGIRSDNRISNLRIATHHENAQNQKPRRSLDKTGTIWCESHGKWMAQIGHKGKRIKLGYFDLQQHASNAYIDAKAKLHTFNPIQRAS